MPTAWGWAVWTVSPPAASRAVRAPSWGEVANLYGDVQPTLYDADYASDAVDQMSADLDVVCPLYGPQYNGEHTRADFAGLVTENPNLPAMFLAVGKTTPPAPCPTVQLWQLGPGQDSGGSSHFAEVGRGFGSGLQGTSSTYWIPWQTPSLTW